MLLSESDDSLLQYQIADALDLSEAAVTRTKQPLVDAGFVVDNEPGLDIDDTVSGLVQSFTDVIEA
ncbi:MAG: hypothetical protein A07HR60_01445 [uncultured archaeon A07HR60]|nr:MAG: hypothetical protein A07HR60_01445 [uncultured archaeon A07HR60]